MQQTTEHYPSKKRGSPLAPLMSSIVSFQFSPSITFYDHWIYLKKPEAIFFVPVAAEFSEDLLIDVLKHLAGYTKDDRLYPNLWPSSFPPLNLSYFFN